MKKLVAVLALISFNAHAAPDCRELPSCESLGFICSAEECGELKALSCPFDLSKKICFPKDKECEVGDILYNDFKCHDASCNKTPIAIVYDTEHRLALLPGSSGYLSWGGYGYDIPDLENCDKNSSIETCATSGKANTLAIINYGKENNISFPPAEFCYNSTYADMPVGTFWLPSVHEIVLMGKNAGDALYRGLAKLNTSLLSRMWSSNEQDSSAIWAGYTDMSRGGFYKQGAILFTVCVTGY